MKSDLNSSSNFDLIVKKEMTDDEKLFEKKLTVMLEDLPDELFLEIFRCLDVQTVHHSFFDLNLRINQIIRSQINISLVLSTPWDEDDLYFDDYPARIVRLTIDHSDFVDLNGFSRLVSLTLSCLSEEQYEQLFLCQFPCLCYLTLHMIIPSQIHQVLSKFSYAENFPSLEYFVIQCDPMLGSCRSFQTIWPKATFFPTRRSNLIDLSQYNDHYLISSQSKLCHQNLKYFEISCTLTGPSIDAFDSIFQSMPHLERLKLVSDEIYYSLECLERLASILKQRLTCLRRFDCNLLCLISSSDLPIVVSLHPCFHRIQYQDNDQLKSVRLFTEHFSQHV